MTKNKKILLDSITSLTIVARLSLSNISCRYKSSPDAIIEKKSKNQK